MLGTLTRIRAFVCLLQGTVRADSRAISSICSTVSRGAAVRGQHRVASADPGEPAASPENWCHPRWPRSTRAAPWQWPHPPHRYPGPALSAAPVSGTTDPQRHRQHGHGFLRFAAEHRLLFSLPNAGSSLRLLSPTLLGAAFLPPRNAAETSNRLEPINPPFEVSAHAAVDGTATAVDDLTATASPAIMMGTAEVA